MLNIIKDKIVIGHAVFNDLKALDITHPTNLIRDTQKLYKLESKGNKSISLRKLYF